MFGIKDNHNPECLLLLNDKCLSHLLHLGIVILFQMERNVVDMESSELQKLKSLKS